MSTIRSIIESNVSNIPFGYGHVVERAIAAVEADPTNPRAAITGVMQAQGLSGYSSYAEPVITALEEYLAEPTTEGFDRDRAAEVLRSYAERAGANMDEVETVLIEAGLVDEPVIEEPEAPFQEGGSDLAAMVRTLTEQVQALTAAAARHGVRI